MLRSCVFESAAYHEILRAGRAADDAVRQAWAAIRSPETVALFEEQGSRREGPRERLATSLRSVFVPRSGQGEPSGHEQSNQCPMGRSGQVRHSKM
ncbi:hypothetical protein GCM10010336_74520 [Streptomyces goshikiensis]|nr:hypothetical protein GCM10010336_74520 [Streptomyces goshikiensis]